MRSSASPQRLIWRKPASFDITSGVDLQEVDNAVNQARKEVAQRYDFKGSRAAIDFNKAENTIMLTADDDFKMTALWEILQTRMVRRGVPTKNLTPGDAGARRQRHGAPGGHAAAGHPDRSGQGDRQVPEGTEAEKGPGGHQADQVRVSSPSKDELQEAMRAAARARFRRARCSSATTGGSVMWDWTRRARRAAQSAARTASASLRRPIAQQTAAARQRRCGS